MDKRDKDRAMVRAAIAIRSPISAPDLVVFLAAAGIPPGRTRKAVKNEFDRDSVGRDDDLCLIPGPCHASTLQERIDLLKAAYAGFSHHHDHEMMQMVQLQAAKEHLMALHARTAENVVPCLGDSRP